MSTSEGSKRLGIATRKQFGISQRSYPRVESSFLIPLKLNNIIPMHRRMHPWFLLLIHEEIINIMCIDGSLSH